jgi:hypothetical protein
MRLQSAMFSALFILIVVKGIFLPDNLSGQSPVQWSFSFEDKGNTVDILATAIMNKKWTIYSQHTNDEGPVPTTFYIDNSKVVFTENTKVITTFDELFEVEVLKFKETATFSYLFPKKDVNKITGKVKFMTCDDEKCLPPADVMFNFSW